VSLWPLNLRAFVDRDLDDDMRPLRPPRPVLSFLAPVAIVGFAVALVIALSSDHHPHPAPPAAAAIGANRPRHGSWLVRRGQTLTYIAKREQTTVEAIVGLNPGLTPHHIHPGERIRVR
jgi:hypothetical protein